MVKLGLQIVPGIDNPAMLSALTKSAELRADFMAMLGWQNPWFRAMLRGIRLFALHMLPKRDVYGDTTPLPILLSSLWMTDAAALRSDRACLPPKEAQQLLKESWVSHLKQWLVALVDNGVMHGDMLDGLPGLLPSAWCAHWDHAVRCMPAGSQSMSLHDMDMSMISILDRPPRWPAMGQNLPAPLLPVRKVIYGGREVDFVQLIGLHHIHISRRLACSLNDVLYAGRIRGSHRRGPLVSPPSLSSRLHDAVKPVATHATRSNTCVSMSCLQSADWRAQARLVTNPIRPASASKLAAFLMTPARSTRQKAAIMNARIVVSDASRCDRCGIIPLDVCHHLLWECPSNGALRTDLRASLQNLSARGMLGRVLAQDDAFVSVLILGEVDQIFSKPPMDARTTAVNLLARSLPVPLVMQTNQATLTPVFRRVARVTGLPPRWVVYGGGVLIDPNGQFPIPLDPYINSSWSSAAELLALCGEFAVNCGLAPAGTAHQ